MIPILDTHLHLLYKEHFTYDWSKGLPALDKSFHMEDYLELINGHGVGGSLFMEVDVADREFSDESRFFSEMVGSGDSQLKGVIASCRPESEDFQSLLENTLTDKVCGLRRILHVTPDEMSQTSLFRENVRSLVEHDLPFDICMLERQLPIAYDLVAACPENKLVLNHCGIPTISKENLANWQTQIAKLASLPNITCKVSGIIAYCASAEEANLETLRPWLESVVDAFGTDRLVIGSDWPVCNLTQGLPAWLTIVREFFSTFSEDEQHAIFHKNAESLYGIDPINSI